jgi:hypothetical protein
VFTARYALSPYIKQIRFVFKGLKQSLDCVFHVLQYEELYIYSSQCFGFLLFNQRVFWIQRSCLFWHVGIELLNTVLIELRVLSVNESDQKRTALYWNVIWYLAFGVPRIIVFLEIWKQRNAVRLESWRNTDSLVAHGKLYTNKEH